MMRCWFPSSQCGYCMLPPPRWGPIQDLPFIVFFYILFLDMFPPFVDFVTATYRNTVICCMWHHPFSHHMDYLITGTNHTISLCSEFSLENKVFCRFFMQEKWPPTVWKFCVFIAAISGLCVCMCVCVCACVYVCAATWHSHVKISCFHCSYFQHMCVRCRSCENFTFSLQLFLACICVCLDPSGLASRCGPEFIAGISESELCCNTWHSVATTQLLYPHLWELRHAIQSNGPLPQVKTLPI